MQRYSVKAFLMGRHSLQIMNEISYSSSVEMFFSPPSFMIPETDTFLIGDQLMSYTNGVLITRVLMIMGICTTASLNSLSEFNIISILKIKNCY